MYFNLFHTDSPFIRGFCVGIIKSSFYLKLANEFLATFSKKRLFQNTLGGLVPKE
nr:MAG TPA: hypothetical protein [Caudoviricetes sp.]